MHEKDRAHAFVTAPIILGSVLLVAACANSRCMILMHVATRRTSSRAAHKPPNNPKAMPHCRSDPGSGNRTDRNPRAEAIVALGGRPSGAGIPASDGTVTAASATACRVTFRSADLRIQNDASARVSSPISSSSPWIATPKPTSEKHSIRKMLAHTTVAPGFRPHSPPKGE